MTEGTPVYTLSNIIRQTAYNILRLPHYMYVCVFIMFMYVIIHPELTTIIVIVSKSQGNLSSTTLTIRMLDRSLYFLFGV